MNKDFKIIFRAESAGLGLFTQRFGEKRTSLPFGPAVTYLNTLLCPMVAEHTSHPISLSEMHKELSLK